MMAWRLASRRSGCADYTADADNAVIPDVPARNTAARSHDAARDAVLCMPPHARTDARMLGVHVPIMATLAERIATKRSPAHLTHLHARARLWRKLCVVRPNHCSALDLRELR